MIKLNLILFIVGLVLGWWSTRYIYLREYKQLKKELLQLFFKLPLDNKKIITTPAGKRVRKIFSELRKKLLDD